MPTSRCDYVVRSGRECGASSMRSEDRRCYAHRRNPQKEHLICRICGGHTSHRDPHNPELGVCTGPRCGHSEYIRERISNAAIAYYNEIMENNDIDTLASPRPSGPCHRCGLMTNVYEAGPGVSFKDAKLLCSRVGCGRKDYMVAHPYRCAVHDAIRAAVAAVNKRDTTDKPLMVPKRPGKKAIVLDLASKYQPGPAAVLVGGE